MNDLVKQLWSICYPRFLEPRQCAWCKSDAADDDILCNTCRVDCDEIWNSPDAHHDGLANY